MRCPRCEVLLEMRERGGVVLERCPSCRGVWIDQGELECLVSQAVTELKVAASLPPEARLARERRWFAILAEALE